MLRNASIYNQVGSIYSDYNVPSHLLGSGAKVRPVQASFNGGVVLTVDARPAPSGVRCGTHGRPQQSHRLGQERASFLWNARPSPSVSSAGTGAHLRPVERKAHTISLIGWDRSAPPPCGTQGPRHQSHRLGQERASALWNATPAPSVSSAGTGAHLRPVERNARTISLIGRDRSTPPPCGTQRPHHQSHRPGQERTSALWNARPAPSVSSAGTGTRLRPVERKALTISLIGWDRSAPPPCGTQGPRHQSHRLGQERASALWNARPSPSVSSAGTGARLRPVERNARTISLIGQDRSAPPPCGTQGPHHQSHRLGQERASALWNARPTPSVSSAGTGARLRLVERKALAISLISWDRSAPPACGTHGSQCPTPSAGTGVCLQACTKVLLSL